MIRTGRLLADIAQTLGYELVGIELFRTRLATATKAQLREEIVLLRWPGKQSRNPQSAIRNPQSHPRGLCFLAMRWMDFQRFFSASWASLSCFLSR